MIRLFVFSCSDSKASTPVSHNGSQPITTQNGSSSLSLLGAYSDSDSNDSEWKGGCLEWIFIGVTDTHNCINDAEGKLKIRPLNCLVFSFSSEKPSTKSNDKSVCDGEES